MSSTGATIEKPAKEKKAKVPKLKKSTTAKTASHPPYFQMIKEALLALKEKNGSSPHAIGKYMEEKHKSVLPENFRKMLALQLKNSASKGKLIKVKASFKLSESGKKAAVVTSKKKATGAGEKAKQTKSKKSSATGGAKKAVAKKKTKKMTPAKAKQPKSIKSPAAKRARKATV